METLAKKFKVFTNPMKTDETLLVFEHPFERVIAFTCVFEPPLKRLDYEFVLHRSMQAANTFFTFDGGELVSRICFDKYAA